MTATVDRAEAPLTLDEPPPRSLRLIDQLGLWGNLGVSLLGFTGAIYVLYPIAGAPALSLGAALVALVRRHRARHGAVARRRGPRARDRVAGDGAAARPVRRAAVLAADRAQRRATARLDDLRARHDQHRAAPDRRGRPALGVRARRRRRHDRARAAAAGLDPRAAQVRHASPSSSRWSTCRPAAAQSAARRSTHGTWHGFWIAVDTVIGVVGVLGAGRRRLHAALALGARHRSAARSSATRSPRSPATRIGLVALVTVAQAATPNEIFGAFMAVPLGTLAFAVLAIRELDQSFVDTYSTAVSVQNLRPRWDRRVLAVVVGALATVLALALNISDYENFLILIGSVFVPAARRLRRRLLRASRAAAGISSETAPARWRCSCRGSLGFVAYQLVNPGYMTWWVDGGRTSQSWLRFTPQSWMSASLLSFAVAAVATRTVGLLRA